MLKNRIISSMVILACVYLVMAFLPTIIVLLFAIALSSVAQMEFYRFMRSAGMPVKKYIGVICGAALLTVTMLTTGSEADDLLISCRWEEVVLAAIVFSVFISHLFDPKCESPVESVSCTLLGIIYVPFLFNFYVKLAYGFERAYFGISETGRMLIFYSVLVIKITDVGAYFTGRLLGRHKMFPRVSPGKTWEGFAGGCAAAVLASMIFCYFSGSVMGVVRFSMIHAVILGLLLSLSGVVGDLFESLMKRAAGAKDSGTKVPGMGGLMDVLDSLLFGVPVLYLYIKIFLETS